MDPVDPGPRRHGLDFQSSICLDAVHQTVPGHARPAALGGAGDPDDPDRPADLALPGAGLSRRQVRPETADRRRLPALRLRLGRIGLCHQPDDALSHLRSSVRRRHRHRLHWHHRPDGEVVPGPARLRHRHGGRRLRLRRDRHHLPDRLHDEERWPPAHIGRVRHRHGSGRRRSRDADALAERRRRPSAGGGDGREKRGG